MVYILHFDKPFHHARHYVGYTGRADVKERFEEHFTPKGNPLVRAAHKAGIKIIVTRTMKGDRSLERQIKDTHNTSRFCPCCKKG